MKLTTICFLSLPALPRFLRNPIRSSLRLKANYTRIKNNLLRGAEKMPEADYSFKPAPESRTFGEVVTHIATVQAPLRLRQRRGQEDRRFEER